MDMYNLRVCNVFQLSQNFAFPKMFIFFDARNFGDIKKVFKIALAASQIIFRIEYFSLSHKQKLQFF